MILVSKTVYERIVAYYSLRHYEAGGIIGGNSEIISAVYFDESDTKYKRIYIPNVQKLNQKIAEWDLKGISFKGLVHNHEKNPHHSLEDIRFLAQIFAQNQEQICILISGIWVAEIGKLYLYKVLLREKKMSLQQTKYCIFPD